MLECVYSDCIEFVRQYLFCHYLSICLSSSLSVPGCLSDIFLRTLFSAGLPAGVLISFVWVLAGLTIGWLAIGIHQYNLQNAAVKAVQVGLEGMC